MIYSEKRGKNNAYLKQTSVNKNIEDLPLEEQEIIKKSRDGLAFDGLNQNNGKGGEI
ncbi:MAG: hypothetical protein FWH08_03705 [Oscillospiraceae bacterium]|nr:hypothetical protein [Oscillospiraceae bacterium]